MLAALDTFEIFVRLLLSWPGLTVLGLIATGIYLASRFAWGKRLGVPRLCAIGYLIILVLLFWVAVTPDPNAMGYQVVPLYGATLPLSALVSLLYVSHSQTPGINSFVLMFVALVVICGGTNCLIFLMLVRAIRGRGLGSTTTP